MQDKKDAGLLIELQKLIAQHCEAGGSAPTPIPGVGLYRADAPTAPVDVVYRPMLCVVAQGAKRTLVGSRVVEYGAAEHLLVSIDLPVTGTVIQASADAPYLAFSLALDPAVLAELLLDVPDNAPAAAPVSGLTMSRVTPDLLDASVRLLRLLLQPADIPVLAPLAVREILYRLLTGSQAAMLRQMALPQSRLAQVAHAIGWMRSHVAQPLRIDTLAQQVHMSASTFHRHFKAVTALSPLQYQQRLRLQEARRQLLAGKGDAASIGFSVGYESPSQFSREYARLFGAPPRRDAIRLRRTGLPNEV